MLCVAPHSDLVLFDNSSQTDALLMPGAVYILKTQCVSSGDSKMRSQFNWRVSKGKDDVLQGNTLNDYLKAHMDNLKGKRPPLHHTIGYITYEQPDKHA